MNNEISRMWNVPLAQRPFKHDPGCHTFPFVTYFLMALGIVLGGVLIGLAVVVIRSAVRF